MFYNKVGTSLFMGAYISALFYSGFNLACLEIWRPYRTWVFVLWVLLGFSLPLGLFQARYSSQLRRLGGVALTFVLHLSAAFLFLNAWTFMSFRSALPPPTLHESAFVLNATLLWVAYGIARAQRIAVRPIKKAFPSSFPRSSVRLVAVADIHAGGTVERRYLERLQKRIEQCRPDMLLLLGDVTDGDISCAVEAGIGEMLSSIEAPLGKYAVLGNHDIYAGADASRRLLREAGVTVLQDDARVVGDVFVLAGRNDPRGVHFGLERMPLASLLEGQPEGMPVLVADHTPHDLSEAELCGVALQLSGHTHGGQVFPFNLLMRWVYGRSSGVLQKGGTTVCISSGAGLWTMPLRTVTNSEIVLCSLSFGNPP